MVTAPLLLAAAVSAATAISGSAEVLPSTECVASVRHARNLELAGDFAGAESALRQAVADYPAEVYPLTSLLAYARRRGSGADALAPIRDSLLKRLLDPAAVLTPGVARQIVGDPGLRPEDLAGMEGAVQSRLTAASADPSWLSVLYRLELRLEHIEPARGVLDRLLAVERTQRWISEAAGLDVKLKRWDSAVALLRELSGLRPQETWLKMEIAEALAEAGQFDAMDAELRPLLENKPAFAASAGGLYLRAAWQKRDAGDDAAAERLLRKAVALDPKNVEANAALANLYATPEERAKADAVVTAAWQNEKSAFKLMSDGSARLVAGDAATAFAMLSRAASLDATDELTWYNLGLAAMRLEKFDDAARALSRAKGLKADRPETLLQLGRALRHLHRCPEAIDPLESALKLKPAFGAVQYELYACYAELGMADEAKRHLDAYQASKSGTP